MTGLSAALSVLGILLGLLVSAAATVAFFRVSYARATIETLRDSNTALTARVGELESENSRQADKMTHLEEEAVSLRSYVSGTEAVRELERKLDLYQQGLDAHRRVLMDRLDTIGLAVEARGIAT